MAVFTHSHRVYRRRRRRVRNFLLLLLIVLAIYYFINSNYFCLEEITIEGNEHIPIVELEGIIGVEKGINLWQVDTKIIEKQLATHPLVAVSQVKRRWPRNLVIGIEERVPAAVLVQNGKFFLVDDSGVAMKKTAKISHLGLPIISGVKNLKNVVLGKKIDVPAFIAALQVVKQIPTVDIHCLQEIRALSPSNLQLIWEGNILVKFGDHHHVTAKLARLRDTLPGIKAGTSVEYIDVSYEGSPVVKFN